MEKLNIQALFTLYNQLSLQDRQNFDILISKNIKESELNELGIEGPVAGIIANDDWIQTDLHTTKQDHIMKFSRRLRVLEKNAKWYNRTM